MAKKVNYGKIVIVVLLSILIWIWADLALDETIEDKPALVVVDKSANPQLWVNFDGKSSANIKITLSGPHTAIVKETRRMKEGYQPQFDFDASKEGMQTPGEHLLYLLPFLQKNKELSQLGLKVISCDPNTLSVNVSNMVEKSLVVKCFDENDNPVTTSSIDPQRIKMSVPDVLDPIAKVILTEREIKTARSTPVRQIPFIQLPGGETWQAPQSVQITTPPEEQQLAPYQVTAVLGIAAGTNLFGSVKVEILNRDEVLSSIKIMATQAAKAEYEKQPFKVILVILDDDKRSIEISRPLLYNFPQSYVKSHQIELAGPPVEARFKLTDINP